jgi:hypothetical protein
MLMVRDLNESVSRWSPPLISSITHDHAARVLPRKQVDGFTVQMVDGHQGNDRVPVISVMPIIGSAQKQSS